MSIRKRNLNQLHDTFWNIVDDIPRPGSFYDDLSLTDKRYIEEVLTDVSAHLFSEGRNGQSTYMCGWQWPLRWRSGRNEGQVKRVAAECERILTRECGWDVEIETVGQAYRIILTASETTSSTTNQLDFFNKE